MNDENNNNDDNTNNNLVHKTHKNTKTRFGRRGGIKKLLFYDRVPVGGIERLRNESLKKATIT